MRIACTSAGAEVDGLGVCHYDRGEPAPIVTADVKMQAPRAGDIEPSSTCTHGQRDLSLIWWSV